MSCASTLILVRHAKAQCFQNGSELLCGSNDVPLTSSGRLQVEQLRQRLAQFKGVSALYSSPLQRARQTAEAAPAALVPKLRVLRSIQEIHCGTVEGWPLPQVEALYGEQWARNLMQRNDDFRWPGGESYSFFRRRVMRAFRAISGRHAREQVIIVTHAGVISQLLGWMHHQNAARWDTFRPGHASITRVISKGSIWVLETFDDRSHLS